MEASAASAPDWLAACRRIAARAPRDARRAPEHAAERAVVVGRGEGGDRTLVIDRDAEEADLRRARRAARGGRALRRDLRGARRGRLRRRPGARRDRPDRRLDERQARARPARRLDRGRRRADDGRRRVRLRLRARPRRRVAGGARRRRAARRRPARRGRGAASGARATGRLELVALESALPAPVARARPTALAGVAHRVRALGSIAVSLCQLAAGRLDGMATLWPCRVGRRRGGAADRPRERRAGRVHGASRSRSAAPLDLVARSPIVAARTR